MGVDYNVYVGPYIRCKNTQTETTIENVGCSYCRTQLSTMYCPDCGRRVTSFHENLTDIKVDCDDIEKIFSNKGISYYDTLTLIDDIEESDDGYISIYLSNKKSTFGTRFNPREDFGIITGYTNPESGVMKMECELADVLSVLRGLFGEDNVSVRWGVISYTD